MKPWFKDEHSDTDVLAGHLQPWASIGLDKVLQPCSSGSARLAPGASACLRAQPSLSWTRCASSPLPPEGRSHGWAGWPLVGTKVALRVALAGGRSFPQGAETLEFHHSQSWPRTGVQIPVTCTRWAGLSHLLLGNFSWTGGIFYKRLRTKKFMSSCSPCKFSSPWSKSRHGLQRLKLQQKYFKKILISFWLIKFISPTGFALLAGDLHNSHTVLLLWGKANMPNSTSTTFGLHVRAPVLALLYLPVSICLYFYSKLLAPGLFKSSI